MLPYQGLKGSNMTRAMRTYIRKLLYCDCFTQTT